MSGSKLHREMRGARSRRRGAMALALGVVCLALGLAFAITLEQDAEAIEVALSPVYTITQTGNRVFVEISSPSLY